MKMNDEFTFDDEANLEEIRGNKKKPDVSRLLNQKKISKWELDEIFAEDYYEEF